MTALELIDLLHRIDGQLGLAVYRAEPDPSTWRREATVLIGEIRKAIKYLEETLLTDSEKPAPAPEES